MSPAVDMPARRNKASTSSPALSVPRRPTATASAPSAWTLWAALAAPPEAHLALSEAQDEDGRFPGDPRRLAVEVFVGDQVPDDHHAPAGKAG